MPEEMIGEVADFFARPSVAAIELTGSVKVGDRLHIKGHSTDFECNVESMQIKNAPIQEAKAGDSVGVKVSTGQEKATRSIRLSAEVWSA